MKPSTTWREHPDWPGYLFSPDGQCLSVLRKKHRLRKANPTRDGYLLYHLTRHYPDGSRKVFGVAAHRLIARIYVGGWKQGLHVNHKSGVKSDNRAENLEWVTPSENKIHAVRVLGQRPKINAKLTGSQVSEIKTLLRVRPDLSQADIGYLYGITHNAVHLIHVGKSWISIQEASESGGWADRVMARPKQHRGGSRCHFAKLTERQVIEIRRILSSAASTYGMASKLAKRFGVGTGTISAIKKRKVWAHLNQPTGG